jgi:type IV secretion system protein VirB9
VFIFGATMPVLVCAPLYVCDLALQTGESVNDLNIGDSVRWRISPATQGAGETAVTHLIIKPSDIGLTTNMVITTNRRTYTIKLVSRRQDWMPPARRKKPPSPKI